MGAYYTLQVAYFLMKTVAKPSPIFTVCFLHVNLASTYNLFHVDTVQTNCFVLPAVYCYNFNATQQVRLYSIQVDHQYLRVLVVEVIKRCVRQKRTSLVFT